MPKSGKTVAKLFLKIGYQVVPKQGKGSHIKLKKKGKVPVIIPDHKELSVGLEKALLKRLKSEVEG